MSKIDKYIDKFKNALKKENLNFTEQRYAVLKILFENDGHYDCEECINYRNSQNYISGSNDVIFFKYETVLFASEYISIIEFNDAKIYLSRAPPLVSL